MNFVFLQLGHESFTANIGLEFCAFESCISLHVLMHLCNVQVFFLVDMKC